MRPGDIVSFKYNSMPHYETVVSNDDNGRILTQENIRSSISTGVVNGHLYEDVELFILITDIFQENYEV